MSTLLKTTVNVLKNGVHKVTSPYGMRTLNGKTAMHNGIDFVGNGTDYIVAYADGTVKSMLNTCAGTSPSTGNYVILTHKDGSESHYYHMKKGSVVVGVGQKIKKGQTLGYMGSTGYSTGAHLHFAIKINGKFVDPVPYLTKEESKPESKPVSNGRTYTVVKGDTLWNIAKKFYGSGTKYTKIYNANKDIIKNPNMIYVGQVLKIPE